MLNLRSRENINDLRDLVLHSSGRERNTAVNKHFHRVTLERTTDCMYCKKEEAVTNMDWMAATKCLNVLYIDAAEGPKKERKGSCKFHYMHNGNSWNL